MGKKIIDRRKLLRPGDRVMVNWSDGKVKQVTVFKSPRPCIFVNDWFIEFYEDVGPYYLSEVTEIIS